MTEQRRRPDLTPGDWAFEPMDPGHSGSFYEPPVAHSPASVYSMVRGIDGFDHCVPIALMEIPQYQEYTDEPGRQGYFDEPIEAGDQDANARLIAAAPELLEACKSLVQVYENILNGIEPDEGLGFLEFADAAIAKAEGRS